VFGLGFSGIIPAYVLAVRELFPPPRLPNGVVRKGLITALCRSAVRS
jgi:hypothetical protein